MSNKRDLNLEEFGISLSRYRELIQELNFAEQQTDKTNKLSRDIGLIEQTAQEAVGGLYPYILKNVTEDITYEHMGVPCGRRQFYFMRRKFFCLLDRKKE